MGIKKPKPERVVVKLQRPIFTTGEYNEILSYVVDESGEQTSNSFVKNMSKEDIKTLFGEYHKVYYLGDYTEGRPVTIIEPTWEDEWV